MTNMMPAAQGPPEWLTWLNRFGHDVYQYPLWIQAQIDSCDCTPLQGGSFTTVSCRDGGAKVDWRDGSSKLTYCLVYPPPQRPLPPSRYGRCVRCAMGRRRRRG